MFCFLPTFLPDTSQMLAAHGQSTPEMTDVDPQKSGMLLCFVVLAEAQKNIMTYSVTLYFVFPIFLQQTCRVGLTVRLLHLWAQ